jgi:hypothetical protein
LFFIVCPPPPCDCPEALPTANNQYKNYNKQQDDKQLGNPLFFKFGKPSFVVSYNTQLVVSDITYRVGRDKGQPKSAI